MSTQTELLETAREWVGDEPDDDALDAVLAQFADRDHQAERAALRILRRRRANEQYSSFNVVDDASWNKADWLKDLDRRIAQLAAVTGTTIPTLPPLTQTPICGPGSPR